MGFSVECTSRMLDLSYISSRITTMYWYIPYDTSASDEPRRHSCAGVSEGERWVCIFGM